MANRTATRMLMIDNALESTAVPTPKMERRRALGSKLRDARIARNEMRIVQRTAFTRNRIIEYRQFML